MIAVPRDGRYRWRVKASDGLEFSNDGFVQEQQQDGQVQRQYIGAVQDFIVDTTPPDVTEVYIGSSASNTAAPIKVRAGVGDDTGVRSVKADITKPDGSTESIGLELEEGNTASGLWVGTFASSTSHHARAYTVRLSTRDQLDNEESLTDLTFQVAALSTVSIQPGVGTLALPLLSSLTLSELGIQGPIAYWDASGQQYVYGTSRTPLQIGTGYWIRAIDSASRQFAGQVTTDPYSLSLIGRGWNFISLPFVAPMIWNVQSIKVRRRTDEKTLAEAQAAGWMEDFAWGWQQNPDNSSSGRYVLIHDSSVIPGIANQLEPWKGYWVKANVGCELVFPPPSSLSVNRALLRRDPSRHGWMFTLSAKTDDSRDSVYLGSSSYTHSGRLQIAKPPAAPGGTNGVEVSIATPQARDVLGVDLRQRMGSGDAWHVLVRATEANADVALSWSDLGRAPRGLRFYLIDDTTGSRRYMRTTSHYIFRTNVPGEQRRFRIEADTSDDARLHANLTVNNSGPHGVQMSLVLSKVAAVDARVITPSGKVVAVLARGMPCQQGLNMLLWNGNSATGAALPRGVYLIDLTATTDEGQQVKVLRSVTRH